MAVLAKRGRADVVNVLSGQGAKSRPSQGWGRLLRGSIFFHTYDFLVVQCKRVLVVDFKFGVCEIAERKLRLGVVCNCALGHVGPQFCGRAVFGDERVLVSF